MKKCRILYGGLLIIVLLQLGCSTRKNTFFTRFYHNTTAYYNAYFNGREAYDKGLLKLETSFRDNYTLILPVYRTGDESAVSSISSNMDRAIKKASKVIKLHSITAKPKRERGRLTEEEREFYKKPEYVKWIDDSYFLLGRAHFYKKDFAEATRAFEYIYRTYKNEPIRFDAMLWLVKTYNERRRFLNSKELLDLLEGDEEFPEEKRHEFHLAYADYHMKRKEYEEVIPHLEEACRLIYWNSDKVRYVFILAQLHQMLGNEQLAFDNYGCVLHMGADYEMGFNARINRARTYSGNEQEALELIEELEDMLDDDKNEEFRDQIYFALANIYLQLGQRDKAYENYHMSIYVSLSNPNQLALSHLFVAELYFEDRGYIKSQGHYDTSLSYLDPRYPNYEKISNISQNLDELIDNINIVTREDSLQRWAQMDTTERKQRIAQIIQEVEKQEKLAAQQPQRYYNDRENRYGDMASQGKGGFVLYNSTALAMGRTEFMKRWGKRKLEDHWRRENKEVQGTDPWDTDDEEEGGEAEEEERISDNKKPEYYLQDIPITDSLMEVSHDMIKSALFRQGELFMDKIRDYENAIQAFEELNERYPGSDYELISWYYLYKLNEYEENTQRQNYYKDRVISKYPESNYAKLLKDPSYIYTLMKLQKETAEFYEQTYNTYKDGDYETVIANADVADTAYSQSELLPKFKYLKALSMGEIGRPEEMRSGLEEVLDKYPKNEIAPLAASVLKLLDEKGYRVVTTQDSLELAQHQQQMQEREEQQKREEQQREEQALWDNSSTGEQENLPAEELYTYKPDSKHLYMTMVKTGSADINKLKFRIINFGADYFTMLDLSTNNMIFNANLEMVSVKPFENAKQAVSFYKVIRVNRDVYKNMEKSEYRHFVITEENYQKLFEDQDVLKYLGFFEKNYLGD